MSSSSSSSSSASSFQLRSLRNNPNRRGLPTLSLGRDINASTSQQLNLNLTPTTGSALPQVVLRSPVVAIGVPLPTSQTPPEQLNVKTLKRKNLRGLSLGGDNSSSITSNSGFKSNPGINREINGIPATPQSASDIYQQKELSNGIAKLSVSNNNINKLTSSIAPTGETKAQIITTKVTISSITPDSSGITNDRFFLNNFKESNLLRLEDLGAGNLGSVLKVIHTPLQKTMAKKTIQIENDEDVKRQIARELKIMNECKSKYIIEFYGSFLQEGNVIICMEYMDIGSLDKVLRVHGPLPEFIINHVAYSVLNGLKYLYTQHKIIHRDIKPSNVLLNSKGNLKLCDFGVSRELIGSVADTFVGTSTYMSPERILGANYTIKGDIWSLGLMLVELATGFFPFGDNENIAPAGILDLLQRVVHEVPPDLRHFNEKFIAEGGNINGPTRLLYPSQNGPSKNASIDGLSHRTKPYYPFLEPFSIFVDHCLIKKEEERYGPLELLKDDFVTIYKKKLSADDSKILKSDIKEWCKSVKKVKRG